MDGTLKSWVAAIDTAGGRVLWLQGPGRTEEFWILDVDGTRLVIEANWSPVRPEGRGGDAGHPGLDTDRAVRLLEIVKLHMRARMIAPACAHATARVRLRVE